MVVHRRKKVLKYRGHTTHGGGHRKKRRGAGSRGGRGKAGTGKRAGHKKAGLGNVLGSHGFLPRHSHTPTRVINVGDLTSNFVERLLATGKATRESGMVAINLTALGYEKLLGTGTTTQKLKLIVERCSASAEEKIKAVGGRVELSVSSSSSASVEPSAEQEN